MQNKEDQSPLETQDNRPEKHDADRGNDGSSNAMLQKEGLIDPGNEHHHEDVNNKKDIPSSHDTDAGGDGTGSTGPEPGEGENDAPDVTGEDG